MIGRRAGASDPTNLTYGKEVDRQIKRLGLGDRIHWTGAAEPPTISAGFCSSDITPLPYVDGVSLRRTTLMTSLAHGKAIITTEPQMPLPELGEAVEMIPINDPDVLADAIVRLWQSPERRKELEAAALKISQKFSWKQIAARTLGFYETILDEFRSRMG
jgi:phosphatidylinositol alpha-mannosyltransferase